MGIRSSAKLDPSSNIIRVLIEMYVEIGDHIALQYGGSEAHKKVSAEHSDSSFHGPIGKVRRMHTVAGIHWFHHLSQSLGIPSAVCAIAQGASYVDKEILQQRLHRSAQTRCNESFLGLLHPIPAHDTALGNGDGLLFAQSTRQGR
jgi:hypothetical protein